MSKQRISAVCIVVAAIGLVAGTVLPWWEGLLPSGSFYIGLRSMTLCLADSCRDQVLSAADQGAHVWAKLGTGTLVASWIAALLCVYYLWSKNHRVRGVAASMALFSGVLGVLFVWLHPEMGRMAPTYGIAATLAGSLLSASALLSSK